MLGNIEWLFFDLGSTLIDERYANAHRLRDAIRGTDISYDEALARAKQLAKEGYAHPLKALGLPLTPWHSEDERVYPEAAGCLAALRGSYRIGVIANQIPGTAERMKASGLAPYLDLIVASAEEGVEKPDLRIFQTALARANCRPERAAMIGDRLDNDIVPAKRLGMTTIWVRQGFGACQTPRSQADTPDYTVNCLADLPALPLF